MQFFYDDRRRESTDVEDMFLAHISGMDTLARGLRNVAKLLEVTENVMTCYNFHKQVCELKICCVVRMVPWMSLSASATRALTVRLVP